MNHFPSYEMVMNSLRDRTCFMDGRHVRGDVVDRIMRTFADAYATRPAIAAQSPETPVADPPGSSRASVSA